MVRRRKGMQQIALAAIAFAWQAWAQSVPLEVEVMPETVGGLFVAALDVGTPPQRILAGLDTASEWLWFPEAVPGVSGGFSLSNSSSATLSDEKSLSFADGLNVRGHVLQDNVLLGGSKTSNVRMILAQNFSGSSRPPTKGVGLLGLMVPSSQAESWVFSGGDKSKESDSFLGSFWGEHAEVPRTLRLELGRLRPRLLVGVLSSNSALRNPSDITLLATTFTGMAPNWYVSTRAIGLSFGKESPFLRMNLDFNSALPLGAPTLLDSGASAIRVGSGVWEHLMVGMPSGCQREDGGSMGCPCKKETIEDDFPTISVSFETMATFRILGLDSGADKIICIPPSAYVAYRADQEDWCSLAIVDAGPRHQMFGLEAVVLGVPFFKSANVLLDVENRVVGVEPVGVFRPGAQVSLDELPAEGKEEACRCADPKNWWSTGKRFSPKRVVVVLMLVSMVGSYVFVGFSQTRTAERIRALLETFTGSGTSSLAASGAGQALAGDAAGRSDAQFLQMANRGSPE